MRVVRRRRFLNDVTTSYAHLSGQSPASAEDFLDEVEALVALLIQFPKAGRLRLELGAGVRAFRLRRYRHILFYRLLGERIILLRLIHAARNIRRGMM